MASVTRSGTAGVSERAIEAVSTRDRTLLRDFLERDRLRAAYAICDLDQKEFGRTKWGVATEHGEPIAVVLEYGGLTPQPLFVMGDPEGAAAILRDVIKPRLVYLAADQTHLAAVGREYLVRRRGVPAETVDALSALGLSSICNVLAAIKVARHQHLGPDDAILTVATDGAAMYGTEIERIVARDFPGGFDAVAAGETFGAYLQAAAEDHVLEATRADRDRIFNLGYFTWVEQQGVPIEEFEARRQPAFWTTTREIVSRWDELIDEFNDRAAGRPT